MESNKSSGDYSAMQRHHYDTQATSLDRAKMLVHLQYDLAREQARSSQGHVMLEYFQRTYQPGADTLAPVVAAAAPREPIRALDFGCGVGRLMEAMTELGVKVDGVDISDRMLLYARENAKLQGSQFFLSSGSDVGEAPSSTYDLVYSGLCFQHICSRTIRKQLLAEFKRVLKPGGVLLIQMHYYPKQTADTVPAPHAPWSADNFDAKTTNGFADVWPTPDQLHLVYGDFAVHFEDLRFQFVTFPPSANFETIAYGKERFAHLIVSGSTTHALAARLYYTGQPSASLANQAVTEPADAPPSTRVA